MKTEIRMALLVLASTSAPAFAQDAPPCATMFDSRNNYFTADNAPANALNRQCFLTVMPKDGPKSVPGFPQLATYPQPQLGEGRYEILLSGGGGGGGSGNALSSGGGGAGAVPTKTTQYMAPGVYKLTIGTSGKGGVDGGAGGSGNPTSITKAYTNETVAGFKGADTWTGRGAAGGSGAADSTGGKGADGRGTGGSGGRQPDKEGRGEIASQAGGSMNVAGVRTGTPGAGGTKDGGGGGGAGLGDGGSGKSGDRMGNNETGSKGGNGFVRLTPIELAQATVAAPRAVAQSAPAPVAAVAPAYVAPVRAPKKDRN